MFNRRLPLVFSLLWLVTSCSALKLPDFVKLPKRPVVETTTTTPPSRQVVLQDFERKIAEQLLSSTPAWHKVATKNDREQFLTATDLILNNSGLSLDLLSAAQRSSIEQLNKQARQAKFELEHWDSLNHLSDTALVLTQDDSEKLKLNLEQQLTSGNSYPAGYLSASAALVANQFPDLADTINKFKPDANLWAQTRLDLVLTIDEQRDALNTLTAELEKQRALVDNYSLEPTAAYRNPYYDIRNERNPEQLALDLITIHLTEYLIEEQLKNNIALKGIETEALKFHQVDRTSTENNITINFTQLLTLPAFEYQAMSQEISGQLVANQGWHPSWHNSLAIAMGSSLQPADTDSDETTLGHLVYEQKLLELAVSELKLALGQASLKEVEQTLAQHLPYTKEQLEVVLTDWYAQKHSSALSVLLAKVLESASKDQIELIEAKPQPESLQQFKEYLAQQLPE